MKILKQINDVDFGIIDEFDEQNEMIKIKTVHGDVLIVEGMIEDEPDEPFTLGVIDGEDVARVAFYKHMDEIKAMLKEEQA